MEIRKALMTDLDSVREIYSQAQTFMAESGNPDQWKRTHPPLEMTVRDIEEGDLYLCVEEGSILGVFYFKKGDDPTYAEIYGGQWLNNDPYGVIHRIAVSDAGRGRGVAGFCFDYCYRRCGNLKIDTHEKNIPMQRALKKSGFEYCGVVHIRNGETRMAFQKEEKR